MTAIDRRTFLRRLGFGTVAAAAAVSTFDLERLLWIPGEKTILLPEAFEAVDFETVDWMTREALRILTNKLTIASSFNRQYDRRFS